MMVTGKAAYSRMEEINRLQAIAEDDTQPESVRQAVTDELMRITAGGPVRPATQRVVAQQALAELDALAADTTQPAGIRDAAASGAARVRELADTARASDLERLAQAALERARNATKKRPAQLASARLRAVEEPAREFLPVRSFVYLWDELSTWTERYDPDMIGPALSGEQWSMFENAVAATVSFLDAARVARNARRDTA
jgi:ParB family chromosome partitioning protein